MFSKEPGRIQVHHRSARVAVAAAVAIALAGCGTLLGPSEPPQFPSLTQNPDPSLHGTVAYLNDESRCVELVAAAGQPTHEVYCLPPIDVATAEKEGKELGPELVWLPDGRLQVTMFRMTDPPGPDFNPGWQRVIDLRTGAVEDVPAADAPSTPNLTTHPAVNPSGDTVSFTSSDNGEATIDLAVGGTTRNLLSVQGPAEGTYRIGAAFWAPDWQWIAADDGRILVVTTSDPSTTRVLTDRSSTVTFEQQYSRFAVTAEDLLTPQK